MAARGYWLAFNKVKDSISRILKEDKKLIRLADFSEFKSMIFLYQDVRFKINVYENRWGQHKLNLIDRNKPVKELYEFKSDFEKTYGVELDTFLKNADATHRLKIEF